MNSFLGVKETLAQRFGRCVRQLRVEAGLSQVEFGERCGFYQTYLNRLLESALVHRVDSGKGLRRRGCGHI